MEFPSIAKFHISLGCVLVLLIIETILLNPAFATKHCDFPAIFNFGDSNSDTGGLSASFLPRYPPYGNTYFHKPAGRFSDGRLTIDFMAKSLGLRFLRAYLDALEANFTQGANFATAASTIIPSKSILPPGNYSAFYLEVQYTQFEEFKSRTKDIKNKGGIFATLVPEQESFSKALYTFDIGQNDLAEGITSGKTIQEVKDSIPNMVNSFAGTVKKIYDLGARTFWIHNTGPLGCLPSTFVNFQSEKDRYGCAKPYNELAKYFNRKLKEVVDQLRRALPQAAVTYVDIYSVKYSFFSNPEKYGFVDPLVTCCGYGGEFNYDPKARCGTTIVVNGTEKFVDLCENPEVKPLFDGNEYSEAGQKFLAKEISTGAFSDPPVPLSMACHRSSTTDTEL